MGRVTFGAPRVPCAKMRGVEWGDQMAWLVVLKHLVLDRPVKLIAVDLLPSGPKERTIHDILVRYRAGMLLTGRERRRRADRALTGERLQLLMRMVTNNPTKFLDEMQQGLVDLDGVHVSTSVLCETLKKVGLTRRKIYTLSANYCEWKRILFWRKYNALYSVEQMVFTDESGVSKHDTMRQFQRYWRGARSPNRYVYVGGKRHTMIPVMSIHGVLDWTVLRARRNSDPRGTNTGQFKRFVRRCILPHLQPYPMPHSVVVMDRASIHFRPDVIELIERRGARVFPTAPYCPWDNPTEYLHSWVNSWLKRNEMLVDQIGPQLAMDRAFRRVPPLYALNAIRHCGY